MWDFLSMRFAKGAVGETHVFLGKGAPNPGSTFNRIEEPILRTRIHLFSIGWGSHV